MPQDWLFLEPSGISKTNSDQNITFEIWGILTLLPFIPGAGVLDPCLGIGFDILTLFRTKVLLKSYPV